MTLNGLSFIQQFESYCPQWLAEKDDPVGLHIGTLDKTLKKVMVTLDVRPEVVTEAIEKNVDLIIAKHPPIFRPVKRLTTENPQNKMYADLLQHDIAVYAAHTNLDIINNGLNDWFCEMLGINETTYLRKTHTIAYKKLAVFVPANEAKTVREVLGKAGAGTQGNYEYTSYTSTGTGRFTPVNLANPAIGEVDQPQEVQEAKIEVIFPETIEKTVIQAMLNAHPYEEPAYDLYKIENQSQDYGLGRVGNLSRPISLNDFVLKVKEVFNLDGLRLIAQNNDKMVQRVAICGGSGEKFFRDALNKQADVYITGDVYYHTGHDMLTQGLAVIDPGHYIEQLCKPKLVELFNQWKQEKKWDVTFIQSEVDTNPFQFK